LSGAKPTRRLGLRAALCAIVALTAVAHAHLDTTSAVKSGRLRVPDPERVRALALGFEPVIADWYWIQALQLIGDRNPPPDAVSTIADLIELVTGLDPWVGHPYRFAALWMIESSEQVRRANAMLARGIAYHPTDWRNRFYLGYNLFFYLGDNAAAADVLETAIGLDGAPPYLGALVTRLRATSGGLDTAALFVQQLIASAEDERTRTQYLEAFDEIETERRARILDDARAAFWRRNGRDIREPAELWSGPQRVMQAEPPPHPRFPSLWRLDPEFHEIVSTYYGRRYRLHFHADDAERRRKWREETTDGEGEDAGEAAPSEART